MVGMLIQVLSDGGVVSCFVNTHRIYSPAHFRSCQLRCGFLHFRLLVCFRRPSFALVKFVSHSVVHYCALRPYSPIEIDLDCNKRKSLCVIFRHVRHGGSFISLLYVFVVAPVWPSGIAVVHYCHVWYVATIRSFAIWVQTKWPCFFIPSD